MHIHYFVLRKIAGLLHEAVVGGIFAEAFTQEKDQVVIGLGAPAGDTWLRVSCGAPLPFVWPVRQFSKARKNVKAVLNRAEGKTILRIHALPYERVLLIDLEDGLQVALKMHGLMSNVLLLEQGRVIDRFRQHSDADLEFVPNPGPWNEAAISDPELASLPTPDRLKAISPILDKHFAPSVDAWMQRGMDFESAFCHCLTLAHDDRYYLLRRADRIQFMLFAMEGMDVVEVHGLQAALNVFFKAYHQYQGYARVHEQVRKPLEKHLQRLQGQVDSFYTSIDSISNERPPEEIGHLLMAHLHLLQQGDEEVELTDFYHDTTIQIKLKPELNPQQNAEQYYQKQKKHRARLRHLEEQIGRLEQELSAFKAVQAEFSQFPLPRSLALSAEGIDASLLRRLHAFGTEHLPMLEAGKAGSVQQKHGFLEFHKDGYTILVGKNARQNDALTFAYSKKEDVWLHARDVAGSHVIVRNPIAGAIPSPVLEYAASIAAHHSKRRHEGLVPVQYTERKYVRKVKNGSPGQVIVDREKVVMVEPHPGK